MKKSIIMLCVLGVLVISGCGTWKNEISPDRNYLTGRDQCDNDAWATYPKLERYDHDETECTTTYNAETREKYSMCNTYPVFVDDNSSPRWNMERNCINEWGWKFNFFKYDGQWASILGI